MKMIDDITGRPCEFCGEPIGDGFAIHEMSPGYWAIICVDCDLVTEVGEGK